MLLKRRKGDTPATPASPERWKIHGDDDPEIVAGGQSNASCLINACERGLGPPSLRAAVAHAADFGHVDEDYWDFVARAAAGRTAAVVWDGNQHNGAFLVQPDPPFRVYGSTAASGPPPEEAGTWVPREMLSRYWAESFADLGRVLDRLLERSRVLVIGTPPPNPDGYLRAKLEGKLDTDPWITEIASTRARARSELPISSESLRLTLWSIIQEGMCEEALRSGATFVPVPASARDPAGLLAAPYRNGDLTHANAAYGGLMWAEMEAALRPDAQP